MNLLVIVVYAGSKKLVQMTEDMIRQFREQAKPWPHAIVAVNNAAERPLPDGLVDWHATNEKNEGFGCAVNLAIQRELFDMKKANYPVNYTHILILNNDLQFPDPNWLPQLIKEASAKLIVTPCTDITATRAATAEAARDKAPTLHREVSAFCWLLHVDVVASMRKRFGLYLFHPQFTNYGSDDVASACFRSFLGQTPFKIVHRSWVRHLKARTANELGVKAGTPELLRAIGNFKRARRLT